MHMPNDARTIVIGGGVAGGASAAARARRLNETARIILLEKDEHVSFANCGLPYYIGGEIKQRDKLLVATPQRFADWFNIEVRTRHEATAIDRAARTVTIRDHRERRNYDEAYDRLILAPGASPIVPGMDGVDAPNVFTLRNVADTDRIKAFMDDHKPRRAAVIGAGYIGLEMVEMLRGLDMEVALVELLEQVLPPLDPEMARLVESELASHDVELHLGNGLGGFERARQQHATAGPGERVESVVLADGTKIAADMVIMGIGVRPSLCLAQAAGLEIGEGGGIKVDAAMRTSDPLIYAVGDAVEYEHAVAGRSMRVPLAGPANRSGRVAGEHAATDEGPVMRPVLGTAIVRVFDKTAGSTGLNQKQLEMMGRDHTAVWVPGAHHVGYYPGAEPMMLKLIFDPADGKVLGAQAVGGAGVDKRLDVIATSISLGATIDDLAGLDLAYAPPFGAAKDPVHMAAFVAQNVMRGLDDVRPPSAAGEPDGVQWLDVRRPDEWEAGHLEHATWIPLKALRGRLDELDRDRPVVTICRGGQRAYFASRLLRNAGFNNVATLSGGMLMQQP